MPVIWNKDAVRDTGTGAYSGRSEPATVTAETDVGSTGAVQGSTGPTTYESDYDPSAPPTGAAEGPGVVTHTQWPEGAKAVEVAENKSVAAPKAAKKATKKK